MKSGGYKASGASGFGGGAAAYKPSVINDTYNHCKFCNRRYNDEAYAKHLPGCERRYKEAQIKNKMQRPKKK